MEATWDAEIESSIDIQEISVVGSIDAAKLKALLKAFFTHIKQQGDATHEEVQRQSKQLQDAEDDRKKHDQVTHRELSIRYNLVPSTCTTQDSRQFDHCA
jgi:predicted Zn-dependent peptidase